MCITVAPWPLFEAQMSKPPKPQSLLGAEPCAFSGQRPGCWECHVSSSPQASSSGWRQSSPLLPGLAGGPSPAHQADQSGTIRTHKRRPGNSRLRARCLAGLWLGWQGAEPSRAALNQPCVLALIPENLLPHYSPPEGFRRALALPCQQLRTPMCPPIPPTARPGSPPLCPAPVQPYFLGAPRGGPGPSAAASSLRTGLAGAGC